jgi:hypothetical protein
MIAAMVEYGHGVGEVAGRSGGGTGGLGSGGLGGGQDPAAALSQLVNDSVNTLSSLPPEVLVIGLLAVFLGFALLKRAF